MAAPAKGEASVAEQAAATQLRGDVMPIAKAVPSFPMEKLTKEMKEAKQYSTLRDARNTARMVGIREKQKKEKAAAKDDKKEGGSKKEKAAEAAGDDE